MTRLIMMHISSTKVSKGHRNNFLWLQGKRMVEVKKVVWGTFTSSLCFTVNPPGSRVRRFVTALTWIQVSFTWMDGFQDSLSLASPRDAKEYPLSAHSPKGWPSCGVGRALLP